MPLAEEDPGVAEQAEWVERLSGATGVFLGGGEPDRLLRLLYRQEALLYPVPLQSPAGRGAAAGRRLRCSRRDRHYLTVPYYAVQAVRAQWSRGAAISATSAGIEVYSLLLCENQIEFSTAYLLSWSTVVLCYVYVYVLCVWPEQVVQGGPVILGGTSYGALRYGAADLAGHLPDQLVVDRYI